MFLYLRSGMFTAAAAAATTTSTTTTTTATKRGEKAFFGEN